jgi:LysM repeat protein
MPEAMSLADYGDWGLKVPEATQLAFYATEALSQGSATVPVVATLSPTPAPPTRTPRPTRTLPPNRPTPTFAPPTPTFIFPTSAPVPTFPPVPIIGQHVVQAGDTIFCIGRTYGVVPAAIAQANGIPSPFPIIAGQVLKVPAVQWFNIAAGPTCAPQFVSPYPSAPPSPPTTEITSTPAAPPLNLEVSITCTFNCGSQEGEYILRIEAQASGGVEPYTYIYSPSQSSEVTFPHCVTGAGTVTVTSADGQTVTKTWTFVDVSCPATAVPTDIPPTPLPP